MDFIKRKDILYPFLICTLMLFVICINYYSFGNFIYDCGREFLVPDAINQGNIPIKDIFLSYFPLSYQINSILFKIFGSSLDVLRISGVFCAYSIALLIYFISREFLDENKSLITTISVCFISMFNVSYLSNYVLSYSYAFIYGVLALFASVFFALKFIKEDKFLYVSFFILGISIALKAEFIFILIPYFVMLTYKKASFKNWMISGVCYSLPLLFSFFALFISGFNINDLKEYFIFIKNFMNSDILKFYNNEVFLKKPTEWISSNISNFVLFGRNFLICLPFLFLSSKFNKKWLSAICFALCAVLIFVLSLISGNFSAGVQLSWLIFPLVFVLFASIKDKNFSLLFLCLISIALVFRFNFIYQTSYLTYTMPVALLSCLIYYAPKNKIMPSFLLVFSIVNIFYFSVSQILFTTNNIETEKGKMLNPDKNEAFVINGALNFIKNKTKPDDVILILPEGVMFNYLSSRKTNLKYYQLLPNHIEAIGEENILAELKITPPDYIFILNTDYSIYGTPKFCKDFGLKICNYTYNNYDFKEKFEAGNYEAKIYKLK